MGNDKIKTAYKAVMSNGPEISIDPSELEGVMRGAASGRFIQVRQGLINPSFLISIVEDRERVVKFFEDTKHDPPAVREAGMKPLKDIFAKKLQTIAAPKKP